MSLGFRGRLILVSVTLIACVGLCSLAYLEMSLREVLIANVERELLRHASGFRASLRLTSRSMDDGDRLAKEMGRDLGVRLSLIAGNGQVVADSDVPSDQLAAVENHASRPEVRVALAGSAGVSRRLSSTVDTELLYVAIPFDREEERWVVRAAMPLAHVDELVGTLRLVLGAGGVIGLVAAIFMSSLASHLFTRTLRELAQRASRLAEGIGRRPLVADSNDEMKVLEGSVNRLAEEVKASVDALAEEHELLASILDAMQEGVVAIDPLGRVKAANPAAVHLLQRSTTLAQTPLEQLLPSTELLEAIRGSRSCDEVELELPGEVPRRVLARLGALQANGGTVVVLHDVTEVRRLEAIRSDFVANVSHELRTPVTIIRANAEALGDGALQDRERGPRFVEALIRNAERLSALVSDLLDLARIESGHFIARSGRIDLRDFFERISSTLDAAAQNRNQTLMMELESPIAVAADEKALEQVLVNLVENAVKYTPPGGQIVCAARATAGRVTIEVRDNGPGIAPEHRSRIFERFYRVDTGRAREMGGTGLGLAIVKHLVQGMGGHIGVYPNQPHGSIFRFDLSEALDGFPDENTAEDAFLDQGANSIR
ncbi:MAG: ATP-binding protein [Myxococcota bacterium]